MSVARGSYAYWLRHLPVLKAGTPVRTYRGRRVLRAGSPYLAAVVDLDVGKRDWQQCMDTIVRLRGEFLWWRGWTRRMKFAYGGRRYLGWDQWRRGIRPKRQRRKMVFKQTAAAGSSRKNFRRFMNHLFIYTGTMHFTREPRVTPGNVRAGDFFVQPARGRAYGHAVLVTDLARDSKGTTLALLGQGFMPAQDFHILRNGRSTWFKMDPTAAGVKTPFWDLFKWNEFRRLKY